MTARAQRRERLEGGADPAGFIQRRDDDRESLILSALLIGDEAWRVELLRDVHYDSYAKTLFRFVQGFDVRRLPLDSSVI